MEVCSTADYSPCCFLLFAKGEGGRNGISFPDAEIMVLNKFSDPMEALGPQPKINWNHVLWRIFFDSSQPPLIKSEHPSS